MTKLKTTQELSMSHMYLNLFTVQVYGQRFLKRGMAGRVYQLARNSPLNDVYFNCLPRSWRLRIRDRLSANQQADVIRPFGDRDVPRSFVAVCHQPKK